MEKNKILIVKSLLYDSFCDEVKIILSETKDKEILYIYIYNYNWNNGFEIPQIVLNNDKCDLSIALLIFYRAEGLSYLMDKSENVNLLEWSLFIKKLYNSILEGKYKRGGIEFKIPLSKLQLFKLKKILVDQESVFIEDINGKCLDIDL